MRDKMSFETTEIGESSAADLTYMFIHALVSLPLVSLEVASVRVGAFTFVTFVGFTCVVTVQVVDVSLET